MSPKIKTLYYYCNDVKHMREFYIEQLGPHETFFRYDDAAGWLTLQVGEDNIVFVQAENTLPIAEAFASQAGFEGGTLQEHSWVLELSLAEFEAAVQRLQTAQASSLSSEPDRPQEGTQQYIVRDPMGFTVELYTS